MSAMYSFNKKVSSLRFICKHNSLGYSAVETLRVNDKKDNSYSSLMSISKALSAYSQHPTYTHAAGREICEIFIPVVVILGDLFEAELDELNNISLSRVDNSAILWSNPACGNRGTIVNIVTIDALARFSSVAKKSCNTLLDLVIADGKIENEVLKKPTRKRKVQRKQSSVTSVMRVE